MRWRKRCAKEMGGMWKNTTPKLSEGRNLVTRIDFFINHRKIKMLLERMDGLLNKSIEGEMPKIEFEFSKKLTKEVTLKLYKWAILMDAYRNSKLVEAYHSGSEDIKKFMEEIRNETTKKKYS